MQSAAANFGIDRSRASDFVRSPECYVRGPVIPHVMPLFTTMRTARLISAIGIVLTVNSIVSAQSVCDHVSRIKIMPFRGESGLDDDYDAIVAAGKSAVPCLIRKIRDSRPKADPRQIPRWGDLKTTVGDTAVVMLEIVTGVEIIRMLPGRYQRLYKQIGVYAELEYLHDSDNNRRSLQRKLKRWYRTTYLPSLRKTAA